MNRVLWLYLTSKNTSGAQTIFYRPHKCSSGGTHLIINCSNGKILYRCGTFSFIFFCSGSREIKIFIRQSKVPNYLSNMTNCPLQLIAVCGWWHCTHRSNHSAWIKCLGFSWHRPICRWLGVIAMINYKVTNGLLTVKKWWCCTKSRWWWWWSQW